MTGGGKGMTDNRAPASQPKPPHICHLCQTPAGKEGRGGASQVLQVSVLRPPCMATRLGVFQAAPAHPSLVKPSGSCISWPQSVWNKKAANLLVRQRFKGASRANENSPHMETGAPEYCNRHFRHCRPDSFGR